MACVILCHLYVPWMAKGCWIVAKGSVLMRESMRSSELLSFLMCWVLLFLLWGVRGWNKNLWWETWFPSFRTWLLCSAVVCVHQSCGSCRFSWAYIMLFHVADISSASAWHHPCTMLSPLKLGHDEVACTFIIFFFLALSCFQCTGSELCYDDITMLLTPSCVTGVRMVPIVFISENRQYNEVLGSFQIELETVQVDLLLTNLHQFNLQITRLAFCLLHNVLVPVIKS